MGDTLGERVREFADNLGFRSGAVNSREIAAELTALLDTPAPAPVSDVEGRLALPEHYQWIAENLPLDNLGHVTSCSAFGDECGCASLATRLAARDAAQRAEAEAAGIRIAARLVQDHVWGAVDSERIVKFLNGRADRKARP